MQRAAGQFQRWIFKQEADLAILDEAQADCILALTNKSPCAIYGIQDPVLALQQKLDQPRYLLPMTSRDAAEMTTTT